MRRIDGTIFSYDWGSKFALADLRGESPSETPQAELWYGSHKSAPSRFVDSGQPIGELPFLVKILCAAQPLSIQTHPNRAQACAGFAREEASGVDLHSAKRTYRDANHKPEMIIALTRFEALCGFRPVSEIVSVFNSVRNDDSRSLARALEAQSSGAGVHDMLESLYTLPSLRQRRLVESVVVAARQTSFANSALSQLVLRLHSLFPGDIGIAVALMLRHVVLEAGQAMFLAAGTLHAYVEGTGVEVMATSDNVVRGGLTKKHLDVPELLRIVDSSPSVDPMLRPVRKSLRGVDVARFRRPTTEFAVDRIALNNASARGRLTRTSCCSVRAGE
jgi:mannose-6-phosphate isomerase